MDPGNFLKQAPGNGLFLLSRQLHQFFFSVSLLNEASTKKTLVEDDLLPDCGVVINRPVKDLSWEFSGLLF